MAKKNQKGQAKSTTLNFRVDEKTKFALEVMARRQHRTISTVVEWAIELALNADGLGRIPTKPEILNLEDGREIEVTELGLSLLDKLWAPHPWQRLQRFAKFAPNLMSFEENLMWSKIEEIDVFQESGKLNNELLQLAWPLLSEYAEGYDHDAQFDMDQLSQLVTNWHLRKQTSPSVTFGGYSGSVEPVNDEIAGIKQQTA
jgi:hypothetical protein